MRSEHSLDVLFLNPHVNAERPDGANVGTIGVPEDYLVRCINPGILSLATYLDGKGYSCAILDFLDAPDPLPLREFLARERPRVVAISCMTGFSYLHSLVLAHTARQAAPQSLIVFGGQHVGPLGAAVLDDCPQADVVALYEGEVVLERLIEAVRAQDEIAKIPGIAFRHEARTCVARDYPPAVPLGELPLPRYDLYPNFASFQPFVEESRGCFAKCEFCITPFTNEGTIRHKIPAQLLAEVDHARAAWGPNLGADRPLALLAATFGHRPAESLQLIDGLASRSVRWTSELRADSALARQLPRLADSGAQALFVGVESCSPTQLLRMRKTPQPRSYLARLRQLLADSRLAPGVLIKPGLLFYIGESPATLRETLAFLTENAEAIRWLSVSPLFVFGGTPLALNFASFEREHGSSLHTEGFWGSSRTYACNVSRHFDFNECVEAARFLEKLFRRPDSFDIVFERSSERVGGVAEDATPERLPARPLAETGTEYREVAVTVR